jgi:hypothetical protein
MHQREAGKDIGNYWQQIEQSSGSWPFGLLIEQLNS